MADVESFPGRELFRKGSHSPIITAMGRRLVAKGCGKYENSPGPEWTDTHRRSYAAWQRKLGFSGSDADGIPGKSSWDRLRVPEVGKSIPSPVPGFTVTTRYRKKGPHWSLGYHTGADYAAPTGANCIAVDGGRIRAGEDPSFGKFLVLRAGGFDYWYAHLSRRSLTSGTVRAGQKIAEVGDTGNTTGPHLHFEKRPAGGGFGNDRRPDW
jgi:murein DD-endopeptidase MepM/ murein hydrolase activator NlpD